MECDEILDLIKRYNIEPQNILGHSDVAPQRKQDPGPLFPWEKLYRVYGIGMWCKFNIEEKNSNQHKEKNIFEIQEELQKFGYTLKINGKNDDQTKKVIRAFQYHFRPKKYDGTMDNETYSILKLLNNKYENN